jgi:transmembrane sensor
MNSSEQRRQAVEWVVRTNDPDFDDWDEFTHWLEQSPQNADAYHRLLASEEAVKPYFPVVAQEPLATPLLRGKRSKPLWFAASGTAAAAMALVAPSFMSVEHVTRPGEMRVVSLGGQDEIVLNGGTRMVLARFSKRDVRLKEGQILLRLRQPGSGPVSVQSGDLRVTDIGTVFEVTRSGTSTEVIVSEGIVVADPGGARLHLKAGQGLATADGASVLKARSVHAEAAGGFAVGQLAYRDERLDRVIRDLRRSTGLDFVEEPAISALRFTGTLSVQEVRRDPRSLEPLFGVSVRRSGAVWRLQGKG